MLVYYLGFLGMRFSFNSIVSLVFFVAFNAIQVHSVASANQLFNSTEVSIRDYDAVADKDAVSRIVSESVPQLGITGDVWVRQLDGDTQVSVILVNGVVAGFIEYTLFAESNSGHVFYFAIDPQYRDKGLGRQLMNYVVIRLKKNGAQTIRLNAYSNNIKAIKFYTKFGFLAQKEQGTCTNFVLA